MNYESMKTVYLPYSDIAVLQAPIHWQEEKKKKTHKTRWYFSVDAGLHPVSIRHDVDKITSTSLSDWTRICQKITR